MVNEELQNITLFWEESLHDWDQFGVDADTPEFPDQEMHARALITWKKITLFDFVGRVASAAFAAKRYAGDTNVLTGAILAFSAVNLFPLDLKIVWKNEYAKQILDLLHEDEEGQQFFYRKDLAAYAELQPLLDYYLKKNIFAEREDRYLVRGRVLNRSFIE